MVRQTLARLRDKVVITSLVVLVIAWGGAAMVERVAVASPGEVVALAVALPVSNNGMGFS